MKNYLNRFKRTKAAEAVEQAIDPLEAPIELKGKVVGVKRMNKLGMFGLIGVASVGIVTAVYLTSNVDAKPTVSATSDSKINEKDKLAMAQSKRDWFSDIPETVLSRPAATPDAAPATPAAAVPDLSGMATKAPQNVPDLIGNSVAGAAGGPAVSGTTAPVGPPTPEEQLRTQLAQRAVQKQIGAIDATPAVGGFAQGAAAGGPNPYAANAQVSGFGMPSAAQIAALGSGNTDQNLQARKAAFLVEASAKSGDFTLKSLKESALSPYELKAGGLIPGVMISGINSDLPGQVSGQVRVDVYDSTTGKLLLIPKGTRLIGAYDSQVAFGQSRILMVWQRMIFPDGGSIDLKGMQGADTLGYAGFSDEVNNHYGKLFGGALLLSVVGAVNIAAAPPSSGLNSTVTPAQAASTAATGAIAQVGGAWAQKQLAVQPTLEIRPGYEFNIVVNKDIVFPGPYSKTR